MLYEDDENYEIKIREKKLQCTDDYEELADLHKNTIKLWKILLYWRKRRHLCFTSPFLMLDIRKIIRSIGKINKFFD